MGLARGNPAALGLSRAERGTGAGRGTHGASRRRGLLCSAYPWGDRGAGAARPPPPPCRLANSTSGLEEKREGRWGKEVSESPAAAGRAGAEAGAPRCAPCRDSLAHPAREPRRSQLSTVGAGDRAVSSVAPGRRAGPGGSGDAWLAQRPRCPVIRAASVGEGRGARPRRARRVGEVGEVAVPGLPAVPAGGAGRPPPGKGRPAQAGEQEKPSATAAWHWPRVGYGFEKPRPETGAAAPGVCLSKSCRAPPDPPPRVGRWMTCQTKAIDSTTL